MRIRIWGARGSIPAPGPRTARYGGNTSCVQVTLSDGSVLVLDAGSGIRDLGPTCMDVERIHILLTHLHLDHIQGLLFFAPFFKPDTEIVIWGPPAPGRSLRERIGRYLSAPLSPIEIRSLPAKVSFRKCPAEEWEIGSARIQATPVRHRGPTLGFRITEGDSSLCYLPDHEPALGLPLARGSRTGSRGSPWPSAARCCCTTASTPTRSTPPESAGATRASPMHFCSLAAARRSA